LYGEAEEGKVHAHALAIHVNANPLSSEGPSSPSIKGWCLPQALLIISEK